MKKTIIFSIIMFIMTLSNVIYGQDLNSFLHMVAENNPEIVSYGKLLDAKRVEARTNLTPSDPYFSFGYLPGNSASIGDKKTWSVNQSFAFPTRYLLQKKLNMINVILAEQEYNYGKLLTLLDAKLSFYDLIYKKKYLAALVQRKADYDRLQLSFKMMLETGEATILEYNKISMELSSLNLVISNTSSEINSISAKLAFMSGNSGPLPALTDYPSESVAAADSLVLKKSMVHPAFLMPVTAFNISQGEVKLSKTGSLPEFQVGYSSEIVPGETYAGPTAGLTIPLWANSNRTKLAAANSGHVAAVRDAELLRLKSEIVKGYERFKSIEKSLSELLEIKKTNGDKKYLDTALNLGEVSVTEYFSYLGVSYQIEDRLLELGNEYHKLAAILNDHELLK